MGNSFDKVEADQARWAREAGVRLEVGRRERYAHDLADNLVRRRLHQETLDEFANGDGAELRDAGRRPAKMRALVSSSALAANFFDTWRNTSKDALVTALGLEQPIASLRFEYKCCGYPVGPDPPIWTYCSL